MKEFKENYHGSDIVDRVRDNFSCMKDSSKWEAKCLEEYINAYSTRNLHGTNPPQYVALRGLLGDVLHYPFHYLKPYSQEPIVHKMIYLISQLDCTTHEFNTYYRLLEQVENNLETYKANAECIAVTNIRYD